MTELVCRYESGPSAPTPKTYIQWVAQHAASRSPVRVREVRLFHTLFTCENPAAQDNFLDHVNHNSREVLKDAMLEVGFHDVARAALEHEKQAASERIQAAAKQTEAALGKARAREAEQSAAHGLQATESNTIGKECVRFQAMRVGYFAVDKDSAMSLFGDEARGDADDLVLNRIVSLKEDVGKAK